MKINHITTLLIVLLLLCGGCSADEPEQAKKQATGTFTIMSRAARTDGPATSEASELINSWWMVFVDDSGTVRLILDRPSGNVSAVEREEFKFDLEAGHYTVYAFANINKTDLGVSIINGQMMPDLSTVRWSTIGVPGDFIPMTGKLDVNLAKGEKNSFEIEVVRLWAKLRFQFTTDTSEPVNVKKISMTPALSTAVNLLPDYNSLGKAPVLPEGTVCSLLELTPNLTITKGSGASATFYLLESTAESHPTEHYPLTFELNYGNGTPRIVSALAYNLRYINRNDYITIPVLITDWLVDVNVLFYPPIGGYPAVLTETKGDEFYAKFGSGGKFVIRPKVTKADGSIVASNNLNISLATEDAAGILSQEPTYNTTTSEIVGEIAAGKTGSALVNLVIKITDGELQYDIIRRFYIIHQNS